MTKVMFRPGDIVEAELFSERMLKRRKGLKSHVRRKKDADVIGYLGELAFERYLQHLGVKYEKPDEVLKKGDNYDFVVWGKKIDVKTSTVQRTVILDERMKWKAEKNKTVLVAVYIDQWKKSGAIVGMGTAKDLAYWKDKTFLDKTYKLYKIPQDKLLPMKEDVLIS